MTFRRIAIGLVLALLAGCLAVVQMRSGSSSEARQADAEQVSAATDEAPDDLKLRPKPVQAVGPGEAPPVDERPSRSGEDEGPPASDAEVRRELKEFRRLLAQTGAPVGARARVLSDGTAVAPRNAPAVVRAIIAAGNQIATTPYLWGGGHGAWEDRGYDCSGSVSFALAGAGLLNRPLTSGGFMRWGAPGRGRWVTIYASPGHVFMVVAGLRFDTSGQSSAGTRWQRGMRPTGGMTAVHPPGL